MARIDKDGWCRCSRCGHKLFRVNAIGINMVIEIKCHSCRAIETIRFGGSFGVRNNQSKPLVQGWREGNI